jgi:hypothetical protein
MKELENCFAADIEQPCGWFNMRFGQSFAVLTACRMVQTFRTGTVQSKRVAAEWAEQAFDPEWRELIRNARAERIGVRFGQKVRQSADAQLVQETARFLGYARKLCNLS